MNETLHFNGTTEARGRNGWFTLQSASCLHSTSQPGKVWIDLYSKTAGRMAPICFTFSEAQELQRLIDWLQHVHDAIPTADLPLGI